MSPKTLKPSKKAPGTLKTGFSPMLPFGRGRRNSLKNDFKGSSARFDQLAEWLAGAVLLSSQHGDGQGDPKSKEDQSRMPPGSGLMRGVKAVVGQSRGLRDSISSATRPYWLACSIRTVASTGAWKGHSPRTAPRRNPIRTPSVVVSGILEEPLPSQWTPPRFQ